MRIGLDLAVCTPAQGGIGRYAQQLTRALLDLPRDSDYVLFPSRPVPGWVDAVAGPGVTVHDRYVLRNRVLRANLLLGPRLHRLGLDVFHSPDNLSLPLVGSARVARVATIHDLIPIVLPWTVTARHRRIWKAVLHRVVARADRLIVPSHATARDLLERLPRSEGKVRVIYHGVDARFTPASAERVAALRRQYRLPARYLLYAGTIEPKKNLVGLLRAYALLGRDPDLPPLVIAGKRGWMSEPVFAELHALGLDTRVVLLGFVPDADLPALLTGAELFVFPSLYEGFGLPPLEAMACGTPVVVGNRSSLPEVVGDAGVLVDPEDPAAIARGIRELLADPGRRTEMASRALARAALFRWDQTARLTHEVYTELC